ncbi:gamma-glutamyl-gamma-aminobutyrate hydrolase family protein [Streptomyces carpinensis]|uniref:Gamma-glutamyl-gamma-aminobutyrate hydrolase family protein n=1 Tax=Streptomyces carpinensis TaxID=66369 RepID=A0ABV1WHT8_9ACTN|nr:gamma-glutamyl-gamma-aminobutyrate hydrolase family protein [Streptomyces carpinensis]
MSGRPVVHRQEVEPDGAAPAGGPRIAVLVSLNFPELTEPVADLVRRFTRTALTTLHDLGARYELVDTSADELGDPAATAAFDGLLLLGGGDVDGELYGAGGPVPNSYGVDRRADDHSIAAIRAVTAARRPVFGVCRGSQLVNIAFGGTLVPDLEDYRLHRGGPGQPLFLDEKVTVAQGSRLAGLTGADRLTVRSGHHQAVAAVGDGLVPVAHAEDGVIEAVEHPRQWVVGVQWHPEDPDGSDEHRLRIFHGFVAACGR